MRITERVTPVLAAVSAVATLACCLPIGGATLLGVGAALAAASRYQQWMLPLSGLLLVVGGAFSWRSRRICHRTSRVSVSILVVSGTVVALVWLFPQTIAGLFANWSS